MGQQAGCQFLSIIGSDIPSPFNFSYLHREGLHQRSYVRRVVGVYPKLFGTGHAFQLRPGDRLTIAARQNKGNGVALSGDLGTTCYEVRTGFAVFEDAKQRFDLP
ncbi:MAG: hypothetical protein HONBIEJF_01869 [Fimbriimonadaceae bacterium]|nr:hypothetical protein [Fimbriimonadaceae bacterium]